MIILVACKYEEDLIKMAEKSCRNRFAILLKGNKSWVSGPILTKFELDQDILSVLVTCKLEETEKVGDIVFPHYKSMGFFFYSQWHITLKPAVRFC